MRRLACRCRIVFLAPPNGPRSSADARTGTTIITFLMVFLIQNTQNRDTTAIQLKLDELIRANENARNQMLRLEDLTENQIQHVKKSFAAAVPVDAIQEPLEAPRNRGSRKCGGDQGSEKPLFFLTEAAKTGKS